MMTGRDSRCRWPFWKRLGAIVCCLALGCGGGETRQALDTADVLSRYERDRRRHDPLHFSEIDLGEYTVTQRHDPLMVYIRFHLYAIIPDHLLAEFEQLRHTHNERIRSCIREVAQRSEPDQLSDPSLSWLKAELTSGISRSLQAPILRDVVFAEFSSQRG
jgi:hypothetical protein